MKKISFIIFVIIGLFVVYALSAFVIWYAYVRQAEPPFDETALFLALSTVFFGAIGLSFKWFPWIWMIIIKVHYMFVLIIVISFISIFNKSIRNNKKKIYEDIRWNSDFWRQRYPGIRLQKSFNGLFVFTALSIPNSFWMSSYMISKAYPDIFIGQSERDIWEFLFYTFDLVARGITMDIMESFGYSLSNLEHNKEFYWMNAYVAYFRAFAAGVFITVLGIYYSLLRKPV
jgi:hypothetical protein